MSMSIIITMITGMSIITSTNITMSITTIHP